jgi:transposase
MTRRKFTSKFKTQVVLEALKERMSMAELAQKFKLNPVQISAWKKEFLENAESVFSKKGKKAVEKSEAEMEKERLLQKIGQQKIDIDFLKKALS